MRKSKLGRFLQRDPIGVLGGLNVYNYLDANPTIQVDASGLMPDCAHNTNKPGDGPFPFPKRKDKPKPPSKKSVDILYPLVVLHKAEVTVVLSVGAMPGAVVSDILATLCGVPFYAPEDYRIGDVTRTVGGAIKDEWTH